MNLLLLIALALALGMSLPFAAWAFLLVMAYVLADSTRPGETGSFQWHSSLV